MNAKKALLAATLGMGTLIAKDAQAADPEARHPGSIVAIGGSEDREHNMVVLKALLNESKGIASRVVIVTTASVEPEKRKSEYSFAFGKLGVTDYSFIYINTRKEAFDSKTCTALAGADIVFFSGGDQLRLTTLLGGTPFLTAIRQMNKAGTVVGGTSAGGAVLSDLMVYAGQSENAAIKGEILTTSGFRFIDRVAFDTHFRNRGRLPRLFNIVASNPEIIGIGLDEDTGVIFRDGGSVFEVIGNGAVTIVDGVNNISDLHIVERGNAATYINMNEHTLRAGARFDITTRILVPTKSAAALALTLPN